ncbi:MAG: hypothetical protein DWP95_02430 [Proteobacteria bacterium]|nr:MAG: hypothetical protein DWP95_02430 [Pseudomonadota bacterium]
MRYIVSIIISVFIVALCILLFNQLFNQAMTREVKADKPDIVFVDQFYFTDNQACAQARNDINNYLKQPETSCQADQDCHFFKYYSYCGNAPVTNTAGYKKLNAFKEILEKNCIYTVQSIAMCILTPFSGYQPICLDNQCISLPTVNESMLKKQIHDTNRIIQNQTN